MSGKIIIDGCKKSIRQSFVIIPTMTKGIVRSVGRLLLTYL